MSEYTVRDIPNLAVKTALVTGATGGLGYETARMLAGAGAKVILAGRNAKKGVDALSRIRARQANADISFEQVDLANLASISAFAERIFGTQQQLDMLINNAGVMAPQVRQTTSDGFELQFGTNHLGHFALTGQLLPLLAATKGARVVSVSSIAARTGKIDFDNLQAEHRYSAWTVYGQSKLANLLFARALQQHSDANGWGLLIAAAHPGIAHTDLVANGLGQTPNLQSRIVDFFNASVGHGAAAGALPSVRAATDVSVRPLDYFGPKGFLALKGAPKLVSPPKQATDDAVAQRLWTVSEALTGVHYSASRVLA